MGVSKSQQRYGYQQLVVPLLVGLVCITATLVLWRRLVAQEKIQIDRQVRLQSNHIATLIRGDMRLRVKSLQRKVKRWEQRGGIPFADWKSDTENYISDQPGYQALGWVDSTFHVRWILPLEGNEKVVNLNLAFEKRRRIALETAVNSRELMITKPIDLVQGGKGINVYFPIFVGDRFDGFLGAVFRFDEWLDSVLAEIPVTDYSVSIFLDDENIYTRVDNQITYQIDRSQNTNIRLQNLDSRVLVIPSPTVLARLHSSLPESTLVIGLLFTFLTVLVAYFAQTAIIRSREIESTNRQLIDEISERKRVAEVLRQAQGELENKVSLRTKELREINQTLMEEVAERQRFERALLAEKERLAVTLRSISDGVITTDMDGQVLLINRIAEQITGYSQDRAAGKLLTVVFPILNKKTGLSAENPALEVIRRGEIVDFVNYPVLRGRGGTEVMLSGSGAPIRDKDDKIVGVVLVFTDITQQRKIEKELQKTQKLQSIGLLAGGIAHDFNNFLTSILGNISLARILLKNEKKIYDILKKAETSSLRAKNLTQQLLTFSTGGTPVKQTISTVQLITETADFASHGSKTKCEYTISDDVWPVGVDEGQIGQVMNNLIINADQAMPDGGTINIRAENIVLDSDKTFPLNNGKYVKLSVSDHGIGISDDNLSKIFDPFFSTKPTGNGLGLATAFSIVRNHGGYITAESKIGCGTTFLIFLPASSTEMETIKNVVIDEVPKRGQERILVMDDDDFIRDFTSSVLTELGYSCETANDGIGAINIYKEAAAIGQSFDAVILDLTVSGGVGGEATIKKLLEFDPKAKAIVSSGYSNHPIMADFRKYGFCGIIRKPYTAIELSRLLHNVLA